MIPDGWDKKQLSDIGDIITGSTPKTKNTEYYDNGTYLWASPSDLGDSRDITETKTMLSEEGFEQVRKIPSGSILFTCIGSTIGKIGLATKQMGTNQQINSVVCKPIHSNEFVYYSLLSKADEIKNIAGRQAVPIINKTEFGNTLIHLPPLPEQKKIAAILSSVDDAIQSTQKVIDQTEKVKQGMLQELLTKGIGHTKFKKTEIGEIPVDWEVKKIGEVCRIHVGKDLKEDTYSPEFSEEYQYPVYSNTVSNYGLYGYYSEHEYEENSLTVVGRGVGLGTAFPRDCKYGAIGRLVVLYPNKSINNHFLSEYINHKVTIFVESGGIPQLTGLQMAGYKVVIPPLEEQNILVELFKSENETISDNRKKLDKLKEIKKGLMQDLLTGKVRV